MIREHWKSRFGFVMTTAGFAIGLGNIWRFPYIMGQNGGAAFLLIYLAIVVLIALPLLTMEMSLGRKAQMTSIEGLKKIAPRPIWANIGRMGLAASALMMCYYVIVMAWVLIYAYKLPTGTFTGLNADEIQNQYSLISSDTSTIMALSIFIFVLVYFVIIKGLQKGVERISKLFMPILLFLVIALAFWANTLDGSSQGLNWYLQADFSKVSMATFLDAMGQAFYSIGVGMAIAFVFGSYLHPAKSDVPSNVALVVGFDTAVALLAGLMIFPALFAFGLQPDSGFGLLFVTMTHMFLIAPYGEFVGTVFFGLAFIAGFTSIISVTEGMVSTAMESFHLSRRRALSMILIVFFFLCVPNILSFGIWSDVQFLGQGIFGWSDFLSGNVLLPISALLISIYVAYVWKFKPFKEETNIGAQKVRVSNLWLPFIIFIIPLSILIILIKGLLASFS